MFLVLLIIGTSTVVLTAVRKGPRHAAATAFALAMLLPCWNYVEIGAVRIDVRTALALVGIGCVWFHPQTSLAPRFLFADFLIVGLTAVVLASESLNAVVTLTVVCDVVLQWLVPYYLGRIVFREPKDVDHLIDALVPVCAVLAVWAAAESVLRMNPVGTLLGHVGSLQSMHDLRWGMRRAEGPLTHPIFFGLHMVLLLPFAMAAARKAGKCSPQWHRWVPWLVAGGAFFTLSRGPQLGVLITATLTAAVLVPRWRPLILAPLAAACLIAAIAGDQVIDLLHRWSGEQPMIIELNGEAVKYTGTLHRLLQVRVYAEAVANAGWLGYGTVPLRAGQNTVPYVQEDLRQMFSSIDNHYLQFALQSGYAGLSLFLLLCASAIASVWRAVAFSDGAVRVLAASLGGALVAVTLMMSSVWLASDYRFLLSAVMGVAGGLQLCFVRHLSPAVGSAVPCYVPLQLTPGHSSVASA